MQCEAVLFDLDGTLVNSEPLWARAQTGLADRYGGVWSQHDSDRTVGKSLRYTAEQLQAGGVALPVEQIMSELLTVVEAELLRTGTTLQPGAADLLRKLARVGVPLALVSSSYRLHMDAVLSQLPVTFAVTIAGDEVLDSKPAPEGYLRAIEAVGVSASKCIAVEDSLSGATAAIRAGVRVICVPSVPGDAEELARLGATVVSSLRSIMPDLIDEVLRG